MKPDGGRPSGSGVLDWAIDFASPPPAWAQAWGEANPSSPADSTVPDEALPALTRLAQLLNRLHPLPPVEPAPLSHSTPLETALARWWQWEGSDGRWPWAAWWAKREGLVVPTGSEWGLLSPSHWRMGREHAQMLDPATLALSPQASRTLYEAIAPWVAEAGWALHWGGPDRWYVQARGLSGLRTASLDRALSGPMEFWALAEREEEGEHPLRRPWAKLQSELQMLLHNHPLNSAREAAGELTVNGLWLSNCGAAQASPTGQIDRSLRASSLASDRSAWLQAWAGLDETLLQPALQASQEGLQVRLTLAGPRRALSWAHHPSVWRQRWARLWRRSAWTPAAQATELWKQLHTL
jgi:hypothetical protein